MLITDHQYGTVSKELGSNNQVLGFPVILKSKIGAPHG